MYNIYVYILIICFIYYLFFTHTNTHTTSESERTVIRTHLRKLLWVYRVDYNPTTAKRPACKSRQSASV